MTLTVRFCAAPHCPNRLSAADAELCGECAAWVKHEPVAGFVCCVCHAEPVAARKGKCPGCRRSDYVRARAEGERP